jgi:hypothetical protein
VRRLLLRTARAIGACAIGATALGACRGAKREPPFDGLAIDLTPVPAFGALDVVVKLPADRARGVHELAVARAWADTRSRDAIEDVTAEDARGTIRLAPKINEASPDHVLALARPAEGALQIHYRARGGRSRFAVRVGVDRMSAVGHAFLLLPRISGALPARVRVHVERLGAGADAASSFGFGPEVVTRATTEDLAHAVYVAGKLWWERADASSPPEDANTSLVVVGGPPFDGRTAWAFATRAMASENKLFGGSPTPGTEPFAFVLVPEPGLGRSHDGASLTRSLGLWFDPRRGLDADVRVTVAHELVHRHIGGAVRLVDDKGREAAWFTEGFTVHFAREALLEAGLAEPADLLTDLRRSLGEPPKGEELAPVDYRRGALWAAVLDSALRRETKGARALRDVVHDLVAKARQEGKRTLPVSALRDALGPTVGAELDRLLQKPDAPVDLPDGVFGPCFKRSSSEVTAFDIGFDPEGLRGTPAWIRGLVKGSPADRAGLTNGAMVIESKVPREEEALHGKGRVELLLGDGKRVRYRPVGKKVLVRWDAAPCERPLAGSR